MSTEEVTDNRPYYYPYRCMPSNELRGKRPQHAEGFCGRPILRKSWKRLPIQGSPCPNCNRRTRINEGNLDFGYLQDRLEQHGQRVCRNKETMQEIHEENLIQWKEQGHYLPHPDGIHRIPIPKQTHSSIFSNVSEETILEVEEIADGLEEFISECEQREARGEYDD